MKVFTKSSIIVLIVLSVVFVGFKNLKSNTMVDNRSDTARQALSTQENKEGNVTVAVTPEVLTVGEPPRFKAEFNTHSVELDFDVTKTITLTNDSGSVYTNPQWEGSPSEGHHRSGTITFQQPLSQTTYIELIIKDVAGVKERKMKWQL